MKKALLILTLSLATVTAAQQAAPPPRPANPTPAPQQADQQKVLEMQLQRDQAAETALRNILMQLQEYRDWLQFQQEIQQLQTQIQQAKAAQPPPPVVPPKK